MMDPNPLRPKVEFCIFSDEPTKANVKINASEYWANSMLKPQSGELHDGQNFQSGWIEEPHIGQLFDWSVVPITTESLTNISDLTNLYHWLVIFF